MKTIIRDDMVCYLLPNCEARRNAEARGIWKRFQAWLKEHRNEWEGVSAEQLLEDSAKLDRRKEKRWK